MKFSDVLKKEREKENLTQAELAKCLSVSPSAIGMWEQGKRVPAYEKLEEIADFFNVNIDTLLGREENYIQGIMPIKQNHFLY